MMHTHKLPQGSIQTWRRQDTSGLPLGEGPDWADTFWHVLLSLEGSGQSSLLLTAGSPMEQHVHSGPGRVSHELGQLLHAVKAFTDHSPTNDGQDTAPRLHRTRGAHRRKSFLRLILQS